MKKCLLRFGAGLLLFCTALLHVNASESPPAQVTLTVTNFRSLTAMAENVYVDVSVSMAPHDKVTLVDREGMPTFVCTAAVDFEITVASADANESYKPLAIMFQQYGNVSGPDRDVAGDVNFQRSASSGNKLAFRNKALRHGAVGRYEFFVLIQRASDGAIGLIDPDIETDIDR